MKTVKENPLLTMIGIKNKKDLEKYSKQMNTSSIKESVDKLKKLNSNKKFVRHISAEREEILMENTIKKFAREEGIKEGETIGIAKGEAIGETKGIATATLNIATSMLKNNYPISEIAKITGLSEEELKKIKL